MISDGILFSYKNKNSYSESLQRIRERLCVNNSGFYVIRDRDGCVLRRFQIAIFDEKNDASVDVCMMSNTLYILAMRIAELKWFVTKNQPKEFSGCEGSIISHLPFEGGYGELGIIGSQGLPKFTLDDASAHTRAMKDYMLSFANGGVSPDQETACKLAFAYFAMTIAEASRFKCVETMMYNGGIDPASIIPLLQNWVVKSSVRTSKFPSNEISIAGVHETRSGKVWPNIVDNLRQHDDLAPNIDDLAGSSRGTRALLNKEGKFASSNERSKIMIKRGDKSGYQSGYEFILDAYFRNRVVDGLLDSARVKLDELFFSPKEFSHSSLAGLKV